MSTPMHNLMAGYQPCPVVFETPRRNSFATRRFKGFFGAIRMLWRMRQDRHKTKAEEAYNEALRQHSIGRFNEAETYYVRCTRLQKDHEPAYINLAALYVERNNADLAIEELQKAVRSRPDHFRVYYNLGLVYDMLGRRADAEEQLNQALALKPDHFWSHTVLGEIAARRDEVDTAIQHYETALGYAKSPVATLLRLAEFHVHKRDYHLAEECLRQALEIESMPEISYNLAWVLAAQERNLEEVEMLFAEAERGRPQFEQALFNLALAQSKLSKNQDAVDNITRYYQSYVKKDHEEMIKYMEYLREVNPRNYPAMLCVAHLHLEKLETERAVEILKLLLKYQPNFTPAVEQLADVYRNMGRYKDAIKTYRELIKYEPNNTVGYLGLAKAYGGVGNYAAAVPVIRRVLELDPNNVQLHYQYGTLMAEQGKLSLAFKHYRTVAGLDPHFPHIQKRLKMLEEEMEEQSAKEESIWPTVSRDEL